MTHMPDKDKDVLVIKKENPSGSGWRPVTVSVEVYQAIKALAEETNMPLSKVAGMLIEFAMARVVIEK